MKSLVTGASGFIGRHLVDDLRKKGHDVFPVDSVGAPMLAPSGLAKFEREKFDRIYHLAAYTRAGDFCSKFPGDQWVVNQQINTNMISWWKEKQSQAHLIALGTSVSYSPEVKLTESNYMSGEPIDRFYSYAMTKRMLLSGLRAMQSQYKLNFSYGVPSTVYGPAYHTDGRQMHFIYDIIFKILNGVVDGKPVVLFGDGHQKRELIFISDFLRALDIITVQKPNEVVNIGSGVEHSIRDFAKCVCEILEYDFGKIKFDETQYVGAKSKVFDIEKLQGAGFKMQIGLKDGLQQTVQWCKEVKARSIPA